MTNTNSPIDFFSSISDPRVERTQKHSLDAILFISLCAVIRGNEGLVDSADIQRASHL
ncbi:MAG: transposase family protein [Paramuribaculum sp.]|nr:transposase family protein [Paramuribaculum sp.]